MSRHLPTPESRLVYEDRPARLSLGKSSARPALLYARRENLRIARQDQRHTSARTGRRVNVRPAANQTSAVADAGQAVVLGAHRIRVETGAPILHDNLQVLIAVLQFDASAIGLAVPSDVRQALLDDAVDRQFGFRGESGKLRSIDSSTEISADWETRCVNVRSAPTRPAADKSGGRTRSIN